MHKHLIILGLLIGVPTFSYAIDAVNAMGILAANACGHGAMAQVKTCEIGSGFLCVNTPELSIVEDTVMIKGTIDVRNNTLSSITVSVQNEYTNEFNQLKLTKPGAEKDCWTGDSNYCLDKDGFFSIKVLLGSKLGPYSILVSATRPNGSPSEEKVRLSRVTAPKLTKEDIKVTASDKNAIISIDLLHSCQFCDFIGISTGGLEATITNIITGQDGGTKQAAEKTNIASGGIFSVCLPLEKGTNNITVSVCNAATGYDLNKCPTINLDPISSEGGINGITWSSPPKLFYSADINPTVELAFKLADAKGDVKLIFNRNQEITLSPSADETYKLNLEPSTGINVGVIQSGEKSYPFSFGWGEMVSPFETGGTIKKKDDQMINTAGGFAISQKFMTNISRGLLNNYFKSDEFKSFLTDLPQMLTGGKSDPDETDSADEMAEIQNEIPRCTAGKEEEKKIGFKITKEPLLDLFEIPRIEFKQDAISFTLNAENLKLWAQAFVDNNEDGQPDKRVLPLIIAFRKIFAPIEIKVNRSGDKPLFLLTGNSTDCAYKKQHACEHKPAVLVPKDFIGSATNGGSFVACDVDADHDCIGVNMLNAQTGLISMTVLDALNNMLYCKGSSALTYLIRERIKEVPIPVKIIQGREWNVPVGLDLLSNQFSVSKDGVFGSVPAIVGSEAFYSEFAGDLKSPEVGFIRRPIIGSAPSLASSTGLSGEYDFGISLGEDFINALLFVLIEQKGNGALDWDYSDVLLKQLSFDTVKKCDEFKPLSADDVPPTICSLRPRISELLGSALTANNYFPQKQPIMMRIRGNRKLPPRIEFFNQGEKQYLDVQLGEVEVSFYALETEKDVQPDKYGNLTVKVSADGNPLIHSMNPADPNPDNGPIVRFRLSALIALEISKLTTDSEDPSKFAITIRTEPDLSHIVFRPVTSGNSTVIPDESLISALNEKINYGINIFADPKKAIKLNLDKEFNMDQFSILGLEKLSFGKDGLKLNIEDSQEYLDILAKLILTQILTFNGQKQTLTIPD